MSETTRRHHLRRGVSVRPHLMRVPEGAMLRDLSAAEQMARDREERLSDIERMNRQLDADRRAQSFKIHEDTERLGRIIARARQDEIPAGAR
jgi:hypothetical protein